MVHSEPMSAPRAALSDPSEQSRHNNGIWAGGDFVAGYATRLLRPVEVMLLIRYRDAFAGRVLEIGCGAGRVTSYIVQLGGDVLGMDLSPRMIEFCRRTYPGADYRVGDLRDLAAIGGPDFDVVFMGNNVIDVLDDAERRQTLSRLAEQVLAPEGLLIMSSHNRANAPSIPGVIRALGARGRVEALHRTPRVPWWILNRSRLRRHEIQTASYAILNDDAHDFRLLHYYIGRDRQEEQFNELGYELLECLDEDGRVVARGEDAAAHGELHYIAHRAGRASL